MTELATKIFEELKDKGVEIGNASIQFIDKVLDDHVQKLVKEYEFKISNSQKAIEGLEGELRRLRKILGVLRFDSADYQSLVKEKSIELAKQQSYIQAKSDIKSIVDL